MGQDAPPDGIDTSVPSPARMYDYFLGGKDNYAADREAAERIIAVEPTAQLVARENRDFLGRAVRHLSGLGVRQFLDIGSGLPTQRNVHQVAPGARVVYVDNDPTVLTHARALLATNADTSVVDGDLRDPAAILAAAPLDLDAPVGLLLVAVLHFIRDSDDPVALVAALASALPAGSHLVLSHATSKDMGSRAARGGRDVYDKATAPFVPRTLAEIRDLFGDADLLDPGIVPVAWWPDVSAPSATAESGVHIVGGVGRLRG
ncbi:SAM-dependent methyltransferase [Actinomadura parmotrematis]|uniref:SAM-dependent methyltransferase n=1 Tax=Actinomadura parmotrematis TaxID=2864039 RepID=A0ABS7FNT4_9ACTN|nr:SAM-dependent methyltransferase [Actinomadura parmotrematis]MBW8482017.1 SAM-dependent methyltransferase [Actinomadura parmotrematis]